jgi:hypothetical protein
MPDSPAGNAGPAAAPTSDYRLDGLAVTVKDAAATLAGLLANGADFANVTLYPDSPAPNSPSSPQAPAQAAAQPAQNQIFATPPSLSGSDAFTVEKAAIAVGASAAYKAAVLRAPGDTDPDQVVTVASGSAWLKQELALLANVSGNAQGVPFGLATANASVDSGANVRLLDYRRHPLTDPVGAALLGAITTARFAFRAADLDALDGSSCLALLAGGSLALTAKVTFSDTLSASLAALDQVLGASGVLTFQTGASIALAVGLSDDFRVIFSRAASGNLAVAIRKAADSTVKLTSNLGVTAFFADPTALEGVLETYIQARLGVAYTDFQALEQTLCATTTPASLPSDLQVVAAAVAQKLGLGDAALAGLKSRICGLEAKLKDVIQRIAAARVQAQFTFGWSRVTSADTVLAFEIQPAALPQYLYDTLFGDLAPVLRQLAAGDPRFVLVNYLDSRTVASDSSFGFSLALGKWSVGSTTSFDAKTTTETNIAGEQRVSLDGRNSYTANWLGAAETYFTDLSAAMSAFAARPLLGAFTFGLHLSWTWQQPPSPLLATRWSDLAAVWGLLPPADAKSLPTQGAGEVAAIAELVLSDAGVRALAAAAAAPGAWNAAWAWAIAAALPPIPEPPFRTTVQDRQRIYGSAAVWTLEQLAGNATFDPAILAGRASYDGAERLRLMPIDAGDPNNTLATFYALYGVGSLWRPASATQNVGAIGRGVAQALAALSDPGGSPAAVSQALRQLSITVTGDPFYMRALGAVIVRLLSTAGAPAGLFTASASYRLNQQVTLVTAAA